MARDFVVAHNPDAQSRLPYLLSLPLSSGVLWLKAAGKWPRATRIYCHPLERPPTTPLEELERVPVRSCVRRGPAIDLILARGLLKRSQFVFARSRGRELIFWQSALSAHSARPGLRVPSGRERAGHPILIDSRERYGYSFAAHAVRTERRALAVGDYAAMAQEHLIAVVERKTISDFATSIVDGSLTFRVAELASVPSAAIAVEGTYSHLLRFAYTRAGLIPDLIARLIVRYPNVSINFLESRKVAEEWTFRYLSAAYQNATSLALPLDPFPMLEPPADPPSSELEPPHERDVQ